MSLNGAAWPVACDGSIELAHPVTLERKSGRDIVRQDLPRYSFHIRDGDRLVRDDEGAELPNRAAARREAALSAQAIILDAAGTGEPLDHVAIEVCDDHDAVVEVIQVGAFMSKH